MKTKLFSLLAFCALTFGQAQTTLLQEGFDNITTLTSWTRTNQSSPLGVTGWSQGAATTFPSQTGATTSYITANFNNTTGGTGVISNWLITPNVMVQNGDVLKFWSRTAGTAAFADRLEVRLSTGATFTAPVGASSTGSFSNLLLSINPNLLSGSANYPTVWTEYTITVSGLSATPVAANFAFRYFVTGAGPDGVNSNYIGIDTFSLVRPVLAVSDSAKNSVSVYPNPATDYLTVNAASKLSSVEIYDMSGKKVAAELVGNTVDVKSLSKGSYVIKINTANDSTTQKFIKK